MCVISGSRYGFLQFYQFDTMDNLSQIVKHDSTAEDKCIRTFILKTSISNCPISFLLIKWVLFCLKRRMILFPKLDFGRQDELVLGEKNIPRQMEYVALVEKWRRDQELSSKSSWGARTIICLRKLEIDKKSLEFFSAPVSSAGYVHCKVFARDLLFTDVQDDSRKT